MTTAVGPYGGHGGNSWDDGCHDCVREITLAYDRVIHSISVVYDDDGRPVEAEKHGGFGGNKTAKIRFDYPNKVLTHISGYYGPVLFLGSAVIRSLTFKTNRRTFGPFGDEQGTFFSASMDGSKVVGFNGRSGLYLDAIGFFLSSN